nr:uncharacterized protein LOC111834255 isoform X2 [Paramormyrops kingsleyae]
MNSCQVNVIFSSEDISWVSSMCFYSTGITETLFSSVTTPPTKIIRTVLSLCCPKITNDNAIPGKGTDPAGEESESDQKTIVSPMEHSTGSSGDLIILCEDHAPEVLQSNVDHTNVDMEEKPMAAQDGKRSNITSDSEVPRNDTNPAGEESESDQKMIVSPMDHSTGSFGGLEQKPIAAKDGKRPHKSSKKVKVHVLVTGEIFNTHETFMQKLKLRIELCSAESSNIILVFCPVVSHIRTDMEAAMARVTEDKPVILVFMHYCNNPSHITNIIVQPSRSNIVQVIHCAFHETIGLLECQENEQAVNTVQSALLRLCRCVDVQAEVPLTQSEIKQQPVAAQNANRPIMTNEVPRTGTKPMTEERESDQRTIVPAKGHSTGPSGGTSFLSKTGRFFSKSNWNISSVKVHVLVVGETFGTHGTFMQKLKLRIDQDCSAESSSVILVFCPVVSQIRTDMEAAMARVTEDKPVILVFMHYCNNPSHITNIIVQPSRSNIVQVVHCAFHEYIGLLECKENEQAVNAVHSTLLRYK